MRVAIVTNANSYADQILDKCIALIEGEYRVEIITIKRDDY